MKSLNLSCKTHYPEDLDDPLVTVKFNCTIPLSLKHKIRELGKDHSNGMGGIIRDILMKELT